MILYYIIVILITFKNILIYSYKLSILELKTVWLYNTINTQII